MSDQPDNGRDQVPAYLPAGTVVYHVRRPASGLTMQHAAGDYRPEIPPLPTCGHEKCTAPGIDLVGSQVRDVGGTSQEEPWPLYRCSDGHYTVVEVAAVEKP